MTDLQRRLSVARGDEPADVVIRSGRVLSVFTREWLDVDVAIAEGVVAGLGRYDGVETIDASGLHVVPGFIDAHVHLESSKLLVDAFARLVLPFGTTSVVADPHEIANVLGADGVHWLIDACEGLPLDVFFMASSCVPASPFESPRAPLTPADLEGLLARPTVIGLAEMMNYPGVIAGDPAELEKLGVPGIARVDGHAPGVLGARLQAYAAAGIGSDHEAATPEEGRERLRAGMWLLIREGSAARNLAALAPLLVEYGPSRIAFCTDDREPGHIARDGHVNSIVRGAIALGVPAEDAIVAATLSPATWHGLGDRGAIAPGRRADLLLLEGLAEILPVQVLKGGRAIGEVGRVPVPDAFRDTVRLPALDEASFRAFVPDGASVRVIGIRPGQIVTDSLAARPALEDGAVVADPSRDLAKLVLVERHHASGRIGVGLVRGLGLRSGAIGSTIAHDAHNLLLVGTSDAELRHAASRLEELGGGIVVVDGGAVAAELPLPVAGLLSDAGHNEVIEAEARCAEAARALGCTLEAPFQTIAFLALSVIPHLKLTDRGLVDVDRFELVPLALEEG